MFCLLSVFFSYLKFVNSWYIILPHLYVQSVSITIKVASSRSWRGVLNTTLCNKVYQWLATGQWFSSGTSVSSTNKTDRHDITEILLNVALNTINQTIIIHEINKHGVSEWVCDFYLMPSKQFFCCMDLYHGENKLHFNEIIMISALF